MAFGLGILIDLPSASGTWPRSRTSPKRVTPTGADIALVLLFNAIMFVLVEVPLAFYVLAPERAAAAAARFDQWSRSHMRQIGAMVATVIGTYLLINGIVGLA